MVSAWLAPLSGLYAAGLAARDLHRRVRGSGPGAPPVPAIGIGNLSAGGTGKTSMVSWVLGELERAGVRAAVLSRGFRRPDASHSPEIVSRGSGPAVPWERAGDEPWLLARRHPRAVVVVGKDRARSAALAAGELGAEVLVLDDAFQQRGVRCAPSILMVDEGAPPWRDHLLPWGRLREPLSASRRAHAAVLVGTAEATLPALDEARIALAAPAWFAARRRAIAVVACGNGARYDTATLAGQPVFLVSAIGNPAGFEGLVRARGARVTGHHVRPDHHRHTAAELAAAAAEAGRRGAEVVLTTEKDAVRMAGSMNGAPAGPAGPGGAMAAFRYLEVRLEVEARLEVVHDAGGRVNAVRLREKDAAGGAH